MKVFERCLLSYLDPIVSNSIDPYQFAYRSKRSVEDAILHVMNNVYKHLEKLGSSVRLMFYDFSSAFNTIQPHLLCDKLINCDLFPSTILWILDYLSSRPQVVKLSPTVCSNSITTNTGAPQGTVLSPFLFSIYTSDCRPSHDSCFVDKYADDTVLTGLITNDFDNEYVHEITPFVNWCKMNHLVLNIDKTKEMVIDFRKTIIPPNKIVIDDKEVERVGDFKYLGVVLDNKLSWRHNTDHCIKKIKPRMYCLRKLKSFDVNKNLLQIFYTSVLSSVLTFGIPCWGSCISKQDKDKLNKLIRKAGGIIGCGQNDIDMLCKTKAIKKMRQILNDSTHPLNEDYKVIPRSGRLRMPKIRTSRYCNSFVLRSIAWSNENFERK